MSYQIDLEIFNGPMDLLLYLIAKEEVDISEVAIARIVDQYMEYLEALKDLNVDNTSDFVVMASTLILIKSKTLLPTEEIDLEEEIEQQDELIQHLLEYKKIKILSRGLQSKADYHKALYARPPHSGLPVEESVSLEEVNLWDILRAFAKIVRETGLDRSMEVIHSEKPITAYINSILDILREKKEVTFESLFQGEKTRGDAICLFIGLLELIKRKVITVLQEKGVNQFFMALSVENDVLDSIRDDGGYHIERLVEESDEERENTAGTEATPLEANHLVEDDPADYAIDEVNGLMEPEGQGAASQEHEEGETLAGEEIAF